MTIKKGRAYINNCGECVVINHYNEGFKYPFIGSDGYQYNKHGERPGYKTKYLVDELTIKHPYYESRYI